MPYREAKSKCSSTTHGHSIADKTEYISKLNALMESKDYTQRVKALDQLVADCRDNRSMIIHCLFPVRKKNNTPPTAPKRPPLLTHPYPLSW